MPRALAVALLLLFGCGGGEPLRLGISMGEEGRRACRIAAAEINAAGGIDGRPLELRFASHGEAIQAQPAIAAADGFARDASILGVVGHSNSSSSLAASQIYNSHRLPHIAPTTTAPLFTSAGPFSYRLVPDDRGQGKFLASQTPTAGQGSRVAIMYVNDDYGRALFEELRRELERLGVEVVYEAPFLEEAAASQFEGTLPALARRPPGLLFWLGRSGNLTPILPPLRAAFPDMMIIGSDGLETPDIYETPSYVGVRVVRPSSVAEILICSRKRANRIRSALFIRVRPSLGCSCPPPTGA